MSNYAEAQKMIAQLQPPQPFRGEAVVAEIARRLNDTQPQVPPGEYHPAAARYLWQPPVVPSRILVTPDRPSLADGDTGSSRIDFSGVGPGWLIGHRGTALRGDLLGGDEVTESPAAVGLRLFFNSGENIITNGDTTAYVPFSDVYPASLSFAPLLRYVTQRDILTVEWQQLVAAGTSSIVIVPSVSFAFFAQRLPEDQIHELQLAGIATSG